MIDIQTAYDVAIGEVHIPEYAVLTYAGYLSGRWVFEWTHIKSDAYSETDRILIWIDPTNGELLKKDVVWSVLKSPQFQASQIQAVVHPEIEIYEYRKIAKEAYFTYSGEPLDDHYWIGEYGDTRYLIDDIGNLVGQMIPMPTDNGCSFSGYTDLNDDTGCWDTDWYESRFNKWATGFIETGCGISEETYRNRVSDPTTTLYQCTAHGGDAGFAIHSGFSINVSYINQIMADRSPIPFAHLCHCGAMNRVGGGTISNAYAKGSDVGTVVTGLKHTNLDSWTTYLVHWRYCFFDTIDSDRNIPIHTIFDDCVASYPSIDGYVDIVGDSLLTLDDIISNMPTCLFEVVT